MTGGAGFIGSHIVDRLVSDGAEVTVLDNISSGYLANISHYSDNCKVKVIIGDILNNGLLRRLLRDSDAVIHLAAVVGATRSFEDPILTNEVNAAGTLHLLKASLEERVSRVIFASSSAVYGRSDPLPIDEDTATRPFSPYAISKITGEYYCEAFHQMYGLDTVCLRYFNVYGPRQADDKYGGVIPIFTSMIAEGRAPIIYGDGEQTRDFVNVRDVVEATILALENPHISGEVFNIGTGAPVSINQLAFVLAQIMGIKVTTKHSPERLGELRHSHASIKKAARILEYMPKVTLEEGLVELVKWHMKRLKGRV